jgi:uncharacterized protein (DUF427 family)
VAKAIWQGVVLAESNDIVIIEGNRYFPLESIIPQYFKSSSHTTHCFWKGEASYFDIEVNGKKNENAAWFYRNPSPQAAEIKDRIAFWKGIKIQV